MKLYSSIADMVEQPKDNLPGVRSELDNILDKDADGNFLHTAIERAMMLQTILNDARDMMNKVQDSGYDVGGMAKEHSEDIIEELKDGQEEYNSLQKHISKVSMYHNELKSILSSLQAKDKGNYMAYLDGIGALDKQGRVKDIRAALIGMQNFNGVREQFMALFNTDKMSKDVFDSVHLKNFKDKLRDFFKTNDSVKSKFAKYENGLINELAELGFNGWWHVKDEKNKVDETATANKYRKSFSAIARTLLSEAMKKAGFADGGYGEIAQRIMGFREWNDKATKQATADNSFVGKYKQLAQKNGLEINDGM